MSCNKNGFVYENTVLEEIKKAGLQGLIVENAGANANKPDADFKINNNIFNLEVKLNSDAQMGGASIIYNKSNNQFSFSTSLPNDEIESVILEAIKTKEVELINLINFVVSEEKNIEVQSKFPFHCSKETWEKAQKNNFLVNVKIPCSIDFLRHHLSKKNIDYIQIGGKGIYWIKNNSANLPVDQLDGTFTVEIRTGRSGSKKSPKGDFRVVTGAIRVQGRLEISNKKSDYSFDDSESIKELLKNLNNNDQRK